MISFKYVDATSGTLNSVTIESTKHEDIHETVNEFVRFLKAVSYNELVIKNGFLGAIEEIDDNIKENYILNSEDDTGTETISVY